MIFKIIFHNTTPKGHVEDARVHCVVLKVRAVPLPISRQTRNSKRPRGTDSHPVPQDPTACRCDTREPLRSHQKRRTNRDPHPSHHVKCSTHELPAKNICLRTGFWTPKSQMLLRKEVIQPHLPVRLPCYDLVLITNPTFDGSLHKGWATGFRCYRLS